MSRGRRRARRCWRRSSGSSRQGPQGRVAVIDRFSPACIWSTRCTVCRVRVIEAVRPGALPSSCCAGIPIVQASPMPRRAGIHWRPRRSRARRRRWSSTSGLRVVGESCIAQLCYTYLSWAICPSPTTPTLVRTRNSEPGMIAGCRLVIVMTPAKRRHVSKDGSSSAPPYFCATRDEAV